MRVARLVVLSALPLLFLVGCNDDDDNSSAVTAAGTVAKVGAPTSTGDGSAESMQTSASLSSGSTTGDSVAMTPPATSSDPTASGPAQKPAPSLDTAPKNADVDVTAVHAYWYSQPVSCQLEVQVHNNGPDPATDIEVKMSITDIASDEQDTLSSVVISEVGPLEPGTDTALSTDLGLAIEQSSTFQYHGNLTVGGVETDTFDNLNASGIVCKKAP